MKKRILRLFLVITLVVMIPAFTSIFFFPEQIQQDRGGLTSLEDDVPLHTIDFTFDPDERFIEFEETDLFLTNPQIIQSVRRAAVKVLRPNADGHGSGTYMKVGPNFFVLTAAHVVEGFQTAVIHARDGEVVIGKVVLRDESSDYAVISIDKLESRDPIPWRPRSQSIQPGTPVCYTGFPQDYDLLTITGEVAGIVSKPGHEERIILHSYAWMGASGSGVFDMQGRFIGILVAAGVGEWYYPQIIEDIVWIVPVSQIDETFLKLRLELERIKKATKPKPKQFPGAATPRRGGLAD